MQGKSNGAFLFWVFFICLTVLKLIKAHVGFCIIIGPVYDTHQHGNSQLKHY